MNIMNNLTNQYGLYINKIDLHIENRDLKAALDFIEKAYDFLSLVTSDELNPSREVDETAKLLSEMRDTYQERVNRFGDIFGENERDRLRKYGLLLAELNSDTPQTA